MTGFSRWVWLCICPTVRICGCFCFQTGDAIVCHAAMAGAHARRQRLHACVPCGAWAPTGSQSLVLLPHRAVASGHRPAPGVHRCLLYGVVAVVAYPAAYCQTLAPLHLISGHISGAGHRWASGDWPLHATFQMSRIVFTLPPLVCMSLPHSS